MPSGNTQVDARAMLGHWPGIIDELRPVPALVAANSLLGVAPLQSEALPRLKPDLEVAVAGARS
jgi:hypothetical protein